MRLMTRAAFVLGVIFIAGSLHAGVQCDRYVDSRAYDDGYYDFCWLSGSLCANCYDSETGDSCAAEGGPCDPYPARPMQPVAEQRDREARELFKREAKPLPPCMANALQPDNEARLLGSLL